MCVSSLFILVYIFLLIAQRAGRGSVPGCFRHRPVVGEAIRASWNDTMKAGMRWVKRWIACLATTSPKTQAGNRRL